MIITTQVQILTIVDKLTIIVDQTQGPWNSKPEGLGEPDYQRPTERIEEGNVKFIKFSDTH